MAFLRSRTFWLGVWQGYTLQVAPDWVRAAYIMGWSFAVGVLVGRWLS